MAGTPAHEVYGTAHGLRARLGSRIAARTRPRRHERFFALTGLEAGARVVDIGCGRGGLIDLAPELQVTGVDLNPAPDYPGRLVVADAADGLPFEDDEFDLAYCNSVIEHVPPARRVAFASELKRVARGWLVQTPAYSFPIEPHALLPGAHWLPTRVRRPYWRLGVAGGWEEISLLRRTELEALFGATRPERIGPLVKSWIALRPPAAGG